jgi:hypothetical protein
MDAIVKQQAAAGEMMRAKQAQVHGGRRRGLLARVRRWLTGGHNG